MNQQFGKWKVLELLPKRSKYGGTYYKCICLGCAKEYEISRSNLIGNSSTQCWKCRLEEVKSNVKTFCLQGHPIEIWGRTKNGVCKACAKNRLLLHKYGISLSDFIHLYEMQDGKCSICNKELGSYFPKPIGEKGYRIEVDHDHRLTGRKSVRGLLCGGRYAGCNRKLGKIDTMDWLNAACEYIKNPPAKKLLDKSHASVVSS